MKINYHLQRQGNVFTPVCDPVHGGGSLSRGGGGLCQGKSLSGWVSVQGEGGLCSGVSLCQRGISVQEGLSPRGVSIRQPSIR